MKTRNILLVLLVVSILCTLAACSGSSLSGKYVIVDVVDDPEGITFEEMDGMYKDMGLSIKDYLYIEILDGDRFKLVMFGEEEAKGTYTRDGDTLTLTAEGGTSTAEVSGKKITWTYAGSAKLVFEKK